jgi:adenosylcobinamide-phosphate synthase
MELSVGGLAVVIAIAIDLAFRELPNRLHPVAWMGHWISFCCRVAPKSGRILPWMAGLVLVASGAVVCAVLGWQIEALTSGSSLLVAAGLQALVLKQTFSIKSLARAATAVEAGIRQGDLAAARQQLAYHLVSRDTSELNESQIAAATIQSVAENTSDSIVAPIFYFAIAGLPGALVYRFINTCDAMVGYRTAKWEWLGKPAARIDDLANLIPSRLTALMILVAAVGTAPWPRAGWSIWFRDRHATESPNAGQPMSAAAGVLGVELEKSGCYRLGSGQRLPDVSDIGRAIRLLWITSGLITLAAVCWLLVKGTL